MGRDLNDLTEKEMETICNDYMAGGTFKEIMVKYDLNSIFPIRKILDIKDIPSMKSIRLDAEQEVVRLYQAGVLMKDILKNTPFKSKMKVYEVLKRHGIPTERNKGKNHAILVNTLDWEYILSVPRGSIPK